MTPKLRTHPTMLLPLAALAAAVALVGAQKAAAAPAASQVPTSKCWLAVINDWLDNNQIDHVYAIPCYTQAIQHLSAYPDVAGYSSAADDIRRAELDAIHQDRQVASSTGGSSNGDNSSSSGGGVPPSGGSGGDGGSGPPASASSPIDKLGPDNAQSVPLPLLVLGGLAVLLLLAAAGTWIARRMQARRDDSRRVAPAPAPVHRR